MDKILQDFIGELLESIGIIVQHVTLPGEDIFGVDLGLRRDILGISEERLLETHTAFLQVKEREVHHLVDAFQCNYYISVEAERENGYAVIGPVIFERITGSRFDELFQKLRLPERLRTPLQNYYFNVSYVPYETAFDSLLSLVFDYHFGKEQYEFIYHDESSMDEWLAFYEGYFRVPDEPFKNVQFIEERYGYENAMLQAVRNGNLPDALTHHGKLASVLIPARLSNALRDTKDLTIALNTNLRKSVEYGGVHPIHIDSLSNGHVKQIESMTSVEQCQNFQRKMVRHYCNLVKEYNLQDYSLPIRRVLTYISSDLTADLSLKSLAEQLSVNSSYLSSLFKKEMGISLTEYVNTARITHAQILLYTTDQPIKNIALQCGISDMYYFSRMFKRITGVTPKVYRDKNMTLSMTQ